MASYQGPTRPGTSVDIFRKTGKRKPAQEGEEGFIGPIRKSGGRGGSRPAEFQGPVQPGVDEEAFRQTGQSSAVAEQQRIAEQEATQQRIQSARQRLTEQNAQLIAKDLTNQQTGDRVRHETLRNNRGERIFVRTNLETGERTTRVFEKVKGRGVQETGGLIETQQTELPPTIVESKVSSVKDLTIKDTTKSFFFGSLGEKSVGFNVKPQILPSFLRGPKDITLRQVKDVSRKGGLTGKVIGEFVPTTPAQVGILGATTGALILAPPVARIGAGIFFGVVGTKQALNPELLPEQRIAGGIIGGLGFTGAGAESLPFLKGGLAKLSPKFRGVKTSQPVTPSKLAPKGKANVIKNVATLTPDESINVQLIPEGKGFGFSIAEQKAMVGKKTIITTSARDLIQGTKSVKVAQGEGGKGLFFTPSLDPKVSQARASRLGLVDLFKKPKGDLTVGVTRESPQIVFIRGQTQKNIGFASGELETTLVPGTIISGQKVGLTSIKGQGVGIFEAVVKSTGKNVPPKINIKGLSSGPTGNFVPTQSLGATASLTGLTRSTQTKTTPSSTSPITTSVLKTISSTYPKTSRGGGSSFAPSLKLKTPTRTPAKTTRATPRKATTITNILRTARPTRTSIFSTIPGSTSKRLRLPTFQPKVKTPSGKFITSVRRGGVFRPIGIFKSSKLAYQSGLKRVSKTLGASFKITGPGRLNLPKLTPGLRRSKKERGVFIEKRGRRLSKVGEKREIQRAKRKKRKKKGLFDF